MAEDTFISPIFFAFYEDFPSFTIDLNKFDAVLFT